MLVTNIMVAVGNDRGSNLKPQMLKGRQKHHKDLWIFCGSDKITRMPKLIQQEIKATHR